METKMRYVQQRVENFVMRTSSAKVPPRWHDQSMAAIEPAAGVIVNLSLGGGAMLLPKNLVLSSNELRLRIPAQGDMAIGDMSISARVRWTDAYYSISRKKIGLQFMKYGDDDKIKLRNFIDWFAVSENSELPCSLQF
jgi:c-di-GMP-binding flagellar brake protein YcgR